MSSIPGPIIAGQPISADALARTFENLRAGRLSMGGAGRVQQHSGGTVVAAKSKGLLCGPRREDRHPFFVGNASTPTVMKVTVRFGQVNSITPTISATEIGGSSPPKLTITDSCVVYLHVELDVDGLITAASIDEAASLPSNTSTDGYITLAQITVDEVGGDDRIVLIEQSVTHSLGHQKCGDTTHNFWGV